jgi:chemotaxis protein MotA
MRHSRANPDESPARSPWSAWPSAPAGLLVALAGIAAGLWMEGGSLRQILQPTAALIVFAGTAGATLVQFPLKTVWEALRLMPRVFGGAENAADDMIVDLARYAAMARRYGVLSLDAEVSSVADPFLCYCLEQAIDGIHSQELRVLGERRMEAYAVQEEDATAVLEAAGGFAPTLGILGAVLGLIQVMQHLASIEEVGKGIAVAFGATLYGVGSANLLLLPCAGRMRAIFGERQTLRQVALEGVLCILAKDGPGALERQLSGFLPEVRVHSQSKEILQ